MSSRIAPHTAAATAVLFGAFGIVRLLTEQPDKEGEVGGTGGHVMLVLLALALIALAPVVLELARCAGGAERGARVAVAGMLGLAMLGTIANIRGEDPSYFAAVASVMNTLWFAGLAVVARALYRARALSRTAAIGMPLTVPMSLLLAFAGGPILVGAYWLFVVRPLFTRAPALQPVSAQ